jgi:hypothetical protein
MCLAYVNVFVFVACGCALPSLPLPDCEGDCEKVDSGEGVTLFAHNPQCSHSGLLLWNGNDNLGVYKQGVAPVHVVVPPGNWSLVWKQNQHSGRSLLLPAAAAADAAAVPVIAVVSVAVAVVVAVVGGLATCCCWLLLQIEPICGGLSHLLPSLPFPPSFPPPFRVNEGEFVSQRCSFM